MTGDGLCCSLLCRLINEVSGIFVLLRAFRRGNISFSEMIRPLSGKNGVTVFGGQSVGKVFLDAEAMPSVFWCAVYGIAQNAERFRHFGDQGEIVATTAISIR